MFCQDSYSRLYERSVDRIKVRTNPTQQKAKSSAMSFQTVRKLSKAKFSVYLVYCEPAKQYYAMKVFPYKDGKVNPYFTTEIRFTSLEHPNVIKMVGYEPTQNTIYSNKMAKISYVVMEYAPYGDFYDVAAVRKALVNEKLVRTYFKQLVEGLEYLHSCQIAHLDLKLENLLLGKDYTLKITDFDLAYMKGDSKQSPRGTRFYRSPELIEQRCSNMEAADIYSLGILLFVFKSGGVLPHAETQLYKGMDLYKMICDNNDLFWQKHCEIQNRPAHFFDAEFRTLFNACVKADPKERATIRDIKSSKWYNGPTYREDELAAIMSQYV